MTAQLTTASSPIMRAIVAIVLTALFFAISDVYAQVLTKNLPPLEVSFLRWAVFVVFLPFWLRGRFLGSFLARSVGWQILRGLLGVLSGITFIMGIKSLSIGDATGIAFCGPVITMALSVWLLGEHVGPRRWLVAAVSLLGVFVIVQPGTSAFQWASMLPLIACTLASFMVLVTRHKQDENPDAMLTYAAIVGFVVLAAIMPFVWVTPGASDIVPIFLNGIFGALANVALIVAYRSGAASRVAPFNYIQLLFSAILGWLVAGSVPTPLAALGLVLIAASGVGNAFMENRAKV